MYNFIFDNYSETTTRCYFVTMCIDYQHNSDLQYNQLPFQTNHRPSSLLDEWSSEQRQIDVELFQNNKGDTSCISSIK